MGAPKGNLNALKHGIYAKRFTPREARTLEKMDKSLEGEIALLRKHIDGLATAMEGIDYNNEITLLKLHCLAEMCVKLNTLVRSQAWITGRIAPAAGDAITAIFMNRENWLMIQP